MTSRIVALAHQARIETASGWGKNFENAKKKNDTVAEDKMCKVTKLKVHNNPTFR